MKNITRLNRTALAVVIMAAGITGRAFAADETAAGPEKVIREFYGWYVSALSGDGDPFVDGREKMEQYLSARFLKEIDAARDSEDGIGSDPVLMAQDFDDEWAKNIAVSNLKENGDTATADVQLKGAQMSTALKISLVKEDGAWKIDKVQEG